MNKNIYCVIDSNNCYLTNVYTSTTCNNAGKQHESVVGYCLKEGEQLLDAPTPTIKKYAGNAGFVKPRWDKGTAAWIEGASAEELAAWEAEHPAPEVPDSHPSLEARVDELAEALDMILSGVTE